MVAYRHEDAGAIIADAAGLLGWNWQLNGDECASVAFVLACSAFSCAWSWIVGTSLDELVSFCRIPYAVCERNIDLGAV
jgi:hypothetical protein